MFKLLLPFVLFAQSVDYPTDAEAILDQRKKIVEAKKNLEKCEKAVINPTLAKKSALGEIDKSEYFIFSSDDYKKKQIELAKTKLENLKDYLDELQAGFIPIKDAKNNFIKHPIKVSDSGLLPELKFKVFQVISKDKALADLTFYYDVQSVYKGMVPVTETKLFTVLVMLKNIDTSGFTDGSIQESNSTFEVKSTETYKTFAGSKTVFVLEPKKKEAPNKSKEQIETEKKQYMDRLQAIRASRKKDEIDTEAKAKSQIQTKEIDGKNVKAKESITKLITGLSGYQKRYDDSFNESKPKLAEQMQEQALTYIKNGDKRLADAIKDVNASTLPDEEKAALIKQGTEALYNAKKKVGIK